MSTNTLPPHIKVHLKKGLAGWLLGTLKDTSLSLPDRLDNKGLFGLALRLMGLSYEKSIRPKLINAVG